MNLLVGTVIYGYAGGWFGRDSYDDRRVEAVGVDWIVTRDEHGRAEFVTDPQIHDIMSEFTRPEGQ